MIDLNRELSSMKKIVLSVIILAISAMGAAAQYPFAERKPVYIAGDPPNEYPIQGIDVSRYQNNINWHAIHRAGIQFAYLKATEGSDWRDPLFSQHANAAFSAGVRVGAYHFYHFCSSPEAQAALFSRTVERSTGWLPPVLDLEYVHTSSCRRRPTAAQMHNEIKRFSRIIEARYGQRLVIYTNTTFYRDMQLGRLRGFEFWLRSTAANPAITFPGQHWAFWQYTGTGALPGIRGNVDINAFAGTPQDWVRWLNQRTVRGIPGVW